MASVNGAITQAEKNRGRDFTPKQKKFLSFYAKNGFQNAKECAEKAGYTTHYWKLVNSLKDDIKDIASSTLLGAAPQAANLLVDTLSAEKAVPNLQSKLQAAKEVLDRVGVIKPEKIEHDHKIHGGLFLMPVKHELNVIEAEVLDD